MHSTNVFLVAWAVAILLNVAIESPISYSVDGSFLAFITAVFILLLCIDLRGRSFAPKRPLRIGSRNFIGERLLLWGFFLLFAISASFSGFMFPVFKVVGLPAVEYNEFGIPGLQGLVNAIYLSISTIRVFKIIGMRGRGGAANSAEISVIVIYPLLMLSRQLLFSLAVQSLLLWWMFSPLKLRTKICSLVVVACVGVVVFGMLGDIRSGGDVITSFMGSDANSSLSILYWFYIYAASPVSNLSYNIEYASPDHSVATFLSSLLPTPLRNALGLGQGFDGFGNIMLINENLNMATFFAPGFFSFGWFGMALSAFILLLVVYAVKRNMRQSAYAMLCYPVVIQVIAFSPFTNLLFYLPVVFQLFIFAGLHGMLKYRRYLPGPGMASAAS